MLGLAAAAAARPARPAINRHVHMLAVALLCITYTLIAENKNVPIYFILSAKFESYFRFSNLFREFYYLFSNL